MLPISNCQKDDFTLRTENYLHFNMKNRKLHSLQYETGIEHKTQKLCKLKFKQNMGIERRKKMTKLPISETFKEC